MESSFLLSYALSITPLPCLTGFHLMKVNKTFKEKCSITSPFDDIHGGKYILINQGAGVKLDYFQQ